jgi:membrane protease YdiL (CAAX protease family)
LGLVLGILAWASGSIWPSVVLHAMHNASLVLLAYYEPTLIGFRISSCRRCVAT